jgi:KDO2-lipid IV(A) lauroyltransferase
VALSRAICAVHGGDALERARAAGRGLLVVAPHLGNWEVLLQFLQLGGPSTVLYRPPRRPAVDALAKGARTRFGMRVVPASHAAVRELLLALRRAETVVVLPDQEPARGSGRFAPFFGAPAWTPVLPHALVQSTDCAVLLGWCLRVPRGFEIGFEVLAPAFRAANIEAALTAMNHAIERRVRAAPAQYQWEYKRFRTRPPGAPPVY